MKNLYTITLTQLFIRSTRVSKSKSHLFSILFCAFVALNADAQTVSGIITDYNGYWKTSISNVSAIKPANSHNLLAFTYNGVQYSTGANDQLLTSRGEHFTAGDFWALPLSNITGTLTSNTKIGVGQLYDGISNGAGSLSTSDISFYLTDGIKGLNIGTGIANLPAGTMNFLVNTINPHDIGDGIPDILVTQIADPSGSTDSYSFTDAAGHIVGAKKDILFTNITPVANWTADFYETLLNPLSLLSGFTNTDRPLRLWAADLSEFGITAANYTSVNKFSIKLSGNSDVAFVGYNNASFSVTGILPLTLSDFSGKVANANNQLNWISETEENTNNFIIEKSTDNNSFTAIGTVKATGNSSSTKYYNYTDKQPAAGVNYYRLKMTDNDGKFTYSKVIQLQNSASATTASLYPNPCKDRLTINHPSAANSQIAIYNANGIAVSKTAVAPNAKQTGIKVQQLEKGIYYAVWQNGSQKTTMPLLIN